MWNYYVYIQIYLYIRLYACVCVCICTFQHTYKIIAEKLMVNNILNIEG